MDKPYRIMLIEDSRTQAGRLRGLFETEGWTVFHATAAESALDELNHIRPDVIVVDYHLPGMRGDEFCREIRMNVNTRGIPVLMLTVDGTQAAETRGLESGADDYLAKSVDADILILRVRALLRKSQGSGAILDRAGVLLRPARILVIDDSPTYGHYLAHELAAENYTVETASRAADGVERIRTESFDCVLVDLEMPDLDGIAVCRRIAEMRPGTERPNVVLMLTASEEKEFMVRGVEAGADDFVGKSADITVVKARIRALLRRRFFVEENRYIFEELKNRELEAVRARAEKDAAEVRATMAEKLAQTNRELEEANRKLKEALGVTRAITENAAEALFMLDAQGRVTFMNPAAERVFGFSFEELAGQVFHDSIHCRCGEDPVMRAECPLSRALNAGITITGYEDLFYRKDGEAVDVTCSSAPIREGGQVTASVLVIHDITERKRSEERLRQAQKLESIGLLAGGIAHDFNNILTGIIGTASLMSEEQLPPTAGEQLDVIMNAADKAANLTRQLLAYAGKGRFVIEDLDLTALIRDSASLVRLSVPRNIEIRMDLEEGLPLVSADRGQLEQILMNLVINAGEAIGTGQGGLVSVSTGVDQVREAFVDAVGTELPPGVYAWLQVSDTGSGMDELTKSKIFDPFFTTKFTGRGLGLAAVSGIMRSQKGAITIDSAPAKGSTFRVWFPVADTFAGGALSCVPDEIRPVILVVDDEEPVREFFKTALERQAYSVLLACDGKEGMALWEQHRERISLVLLDLVMPVMSGQLLFAEIKGRDPDVSFLLTSGYNEAEAKRLCAAYENTTFIQKPYSAQVLVAKVAAAMGPQVRKAGRCTSS